MYVKLDKYTGSLLIRIIDAHVEILKGRYDQMSDTIINQGRPANGYQSMVLVNTEMQMDRLMDVSRQIDILSRI